MRTVRNGFGRGSNDSFVVAIFFAVADVVACGVQLFPFSLMLRLGFGMLLF